MEIIFLVVGAIAGMIAGAFTGSVVCGDKDEDAIETFAMIGGFLNWLGVGLAIVIVIIATLVYVIASIGK